MTRLSWPKTSSTTASTAWRLLAYPTHARRLLPRLAATYVLHFALDALKDYLRCTPNGVQPLMAIARRRRAYNKMRPYVEALL